MREKVAELERGGRRDEGDVADPVRMGSGELKSEMSTEGECDDMRGRIREVREVGAAIGTRRENGGW